jgi:hypothetical protein
MSPLFDRESQTLTPRCVRALKRIFTLCDHDKDGTLSDAELNAFQVLTSPSYIRCQNRGLFIIEYNNLTPCSLNTGLFTSCYGRLCCGRLTCI